MLLSRRGARFANELGTRDYVTGRMIETDPDSLQFALVLNDKTAAKAATHIGLYTKKALIQRFETLQDLAAWGFWGGGVGAAALEQEMQRYDAAAAAGVDAFNKTFFHNTPLAGAGPYYAGIVTPVIHYCMGGLAIAADGRVLREDGSALPGLYAAGEVIGGLHGRNRLGGNALSECVVFGRVIGEGLQLGEREPPREAAARESAADGPSAPPEGGALRSITRAELSVHTSEESPPPPLLLFPLLCVLREPEPPPPPPFAGELLGGDRRGGL